MNAPFAPKAYRVENGQVMAGPDCKFAPGCQNISTQVYDGQIHAVEAFMRILPVENGGWE